ncbi:hypothetical protein F2Q68_00023147 [Brassica cretica]|uniref:BZIP domain-containing protein n=1 Tax=Brassica cretica TaxID=69181 RepID=A0A8S9FXV3_BRACR|nr:hypothetical protein F2Q68_00023147 [Brassica cretica]
MADMSPITDVSTDGDRDLGSEGALVVNTAASDSSERSKNKLDQKTVRRLAQNREAARKSRLRKKAYVQQLENSRLKLTQLEQELQRARQQLHLLVIDDDSFDFIALRNEFALKGRHKWILSLAIKCVSTESKMADMSPLTDVSTDGDRDLGSEGALVVNTAASDSSERSKNKLDQKTVRRLAQNREAARKSRLRKKAYVQQLENSRLKLTQLEQELQRARQQADNLRLQTLQQMIRVLTTRQSARALLAIHDYSSRLRALSSLWLARPRE